MKKINCVIIEDEIAGQVLLKRKLELYPECIVCGVFDTKEDAVAYLSENEVDLVFLDIHLKGGSGVDVVKALEDRTFESIFITAHAKYAIESLNNNYASYYILKPINEVDFRSAMDTILKKIKAKQRFANVLVTDKGVQYAIPANEIYYFQSDGTYTHIFTETKEYLSSKNIGYFESILPEDDFFRIHHSYLINISKGKELIRTKGGSVIMENGVELPVSQRKLSAFIKMIQERVYTDV